LNNLRLILDISPAHSPNIYFVQATKAEVTSVILVPSFGHAQKALSMGQSCAFSPFSGFSIERGHLSFRRAGVVEREILRHHSLSEITLAIGLYY